MRNEILKSDEFLSASFTQKGIWISLYSYYLMLKKENPKADNNIAFCATRERCLKIGWIDIVKTEKECNLYRIVSHKDRIIRINLFMNTSEKLEKQAETIYQIYPRKVAKPNAIRAIKKALQREGFDIIYENTKEYARIREGEDKNFTPHPATWYNQERYNDDPSTWGKEKKKSFKKDNFRI